MKISSFAFNIARSKLGEFIVGIGFEKFSSVLPIKPIKENQFVIAFYHPKPFWEKHILIVPKKRISGLPSISTKNEKYISEMYKMVADLVKELGWEESAYSTLINGGTRQDVPQLHLHLFCGAETNQG